jgi:LPS-assembly lipoprotein
MAPAGTYVPRLLACKKAERDGHFPDRRESIRGGCGKNVLFFTLRKMPVPSRLLRAVRWFVNVIAALSAVLGLAACGFRLMGSDSLPGVLARPYLSLKDPYTDFSREFEHQLKNSGAAPQALRANATATIDVTKDTVVQRTLSVSALNIPTEYELTYTVTFAVQGTDKELLAPQTISLSQDYSFEENVLLAKEHEADILRQQMARDLVSIAMRRLTSLK